MISKEKTRKPLTGKNLQGNTTFIAQVVHFQRFFTKIYPKMKWL